MLLEVKDLRVQFQTPERTLEVCNDVSFSLEKGAVLGIIGESGSGKTITTKAILRLLPDNASVTAEKITYKDTDIYGMAPADFDRLRGREIAMIFQDPVGSFNPVKTIGWHFKHAVGRRKGERIGRKEVYDLAVDALRKVDIRTAGDVLRKYPHQLSGGMLQRCLIALVLSMKPSLIVADEPTTNLDNLVERQIVDLFDVLREEIDAGFIFITHDMTIAERICDDIVVMYAGQVVEHAAAVSIMSDPKHPYTRGLIKTARELERHVEELTEIRGELSSQHWPANKCRFGPRCNSYQAICDRNLSLAPLPGQRSVRCAREDQLEVSE